MTERLPSDLVVTRRRQQATAFADSWKASHVLTWYPRLGRVAAWPVRLVRAMGASGERVFAQSLQDYQDGGQPPWELHPDQTWRWMGLSGYRGEAGTAACEPIPGT